MPIRQQWKCADQAAASYPTQCSMMHVSVTFKLLYCQTVVRPRSCSTATTTTVLQPSVRDYSGELVPEETFTHSHLS